MKQTKEMPRCFFNHKKRRRDTNNKNIAKDQTVRSCSKLIYIRFLICGSLNETEKEKRAAEHMFNLGKHYKMYASICEKITYKHTFFVDKNMY
ncbi:hypothetical protein QJ48_20860 [Paenibacillus sp. A3]|nr:hypothetical protein QJ48_20860 [Paenibacillus sp. A3]